MSATEHALTTMDHSLQIQHEPEPIAPDGAHCAVAHGSALWTLPKLAERADGSIVRLFGETGLRPCPACRGYELESQWCDHCKRAGHVLVPNASGQTDGGDKL